MEYLAGLISGGLWNLQLVGFIRRRIIRLMLFSIPRRGISFDTSQSENQRINLQRRKKDGPLPPGKKLECLSWRVVVEDRADLGADLRQVEMRQDKGLQINNQMLVGRKNEVVGELDLAVEVLAAALGVELDDVVQHNSFHLMMLVMVPQAMHAFSGGITEATRDMMIFGAVMELHVPADRDKQHGKSHQKGADLQQTFFHTAKIDIFPLHTYLAEVFVIHQTGVCRESPMLIVAAWAA